VTFDGPANTLNHDVLTDIYGEEDWSTTMRDAEESADKRDRSRRDEVEHEAAAG